MTPNGKFTSYARLTEEQKESIIEGYLSARRMGAGMGHAVAIAAADGLKLTDRQWNGATGANAYAAAAGLLLLRGCLTASEQ